ncbi:MAG TPA: glycosyltransferase [Phycisphaerae bacterium]
MPPRRLLYVITDLQRGGVPLHLYRLARHVREHGFEPRVVSLAPPGPVSAMLEEAGIATAACEARGAWDARAVLRLGRHIAAFAPELIHSFLFHANVAAGLAARQAGFDRARVISEIQTVEIERRWHLVVERFTYRLCRVIVGNSPSVIEHLRVAARVPNEYLHLIMGGVDAAAIRSATPLSKTALGLPPNDPVVMWVGRMDPVKGLDELIAAMVRVRAHTACRLVLVGDGPYREHIERAARRGGLADAVLFLGSRGDVSQLLPLADVFAFPSRTEGLPNALLEALAAGCPIVTTDVPGCRDIIRHEVTGLLVPRGDVRRLSDAIAKLLVDRRLGQSLGQAAALDAVERFSLNRMLSQYVELYRQSCS